MMHAVEMLKPEDPPLKRSKEPCGIWCCFVISIGVFIRLFCLVAGGIQCAMGGYTFYMIASTKDKSAVNILQLAVIGLYGVLTGIMIIYAELRNRWTRKSLKVFIFLCNGLARGLVYILVGCINIPIPFKIKFGSIELNAMYIGAVIIFAGIISVIYWAFTWRRKRVMHRNDIAAQQMADHKTQIYELFEQKQTADPKKSGEVEMKPVQEA